MDPLESVRQYREQENGGRVVRVAPPAPVLPTVEVAAPPVDLDDTGELDLTDLEGPGPVAEGTAAHIPGTPRGRKRLLQVYLPAPTRQLLQSARDGHGSLGAAAMAALRGSYEHIVAHHTPEPVEAVGPFPAPRTVRRREHVDDARMKPIYVDPVEAAAIEQLADQCELSLSELVTIAIDWWYGEGLALPVSRSRRDAAEDVRH
jgi:hypothetical protein